MVTQSNKHRLIKLLSLVRILKVLRKFKMFKILKIMMNRMIKEIVLQFTQNVIIEDQN